MYMAMPSFILSIIALLMFWLPPESGEKMSLGMTVFVAFTLLMFSLSDDLPESSDTFPIIGMLIKNIIFLSTPVLCTVGSCGSLSVRLSVTGPKLLDQNSD